MQANWSEGQIPPHPAPLPRREEASCEEFLYKTGTLIISAASAIAITMTANKILESYKVVEETRKKVALWTLLASWALSIPPAFLCCVRIGKCLNGSSEVTPPPQQDPPPPQDLPPEELPPRPLPGTSLFRQHCLLDDIEP